MNESDDQFVERATELRHLALTEPMEVDPDDVGAILSNPVASHPAHGAAIVALLNVARVRDDVGATFVDDLGRLLGRPSLETALVLRCLRQLATNDPKAVLVLRDEIVDHVSTKPTDVTQAATGCCVELVATAPGEFVDLVPTLSTLLDTENDQIRANAVYVLSGVAHEYPEEVKPVVPQLIDGVTDRDHAYQANALSALGAVVSAYPAIGTSATETLAEIAGSGAPTNVRANAVGLLGDIATEHPADVRDHVPVLVSCLHTDDEYLSGNAAAALLHVAVDDSEATEVAIPALVELLDDPSPVVRRNACKALGHLEATVALEQLRSMADSDPDEGVRSIAAWATTRVT
ncbi:HEAT repeat domain-containing protein [Natronosalvus vescus]|uniref:HEAT repeat domain-containing protein n=1 Tax=Natronosalvus vescus TaxID=2953881 RepID=UPI00209058E4|nr:HEAT repeat domain-containing protein [Natronosalvus vescus]